MCDRLGQVCTSTGYFRDDVRRADLVLVVKQECCRMCKKKRHAMVRAYLLKMVQNGLDLEIENGKMPEHKHLTFIKVHAKEEFIEKHGQYYVYQKDFQDRHLELLTQPKGKNCVFPWPRANMEGAYLSVIRENYPGSGNYSTLNRSRIVYEFLLNAVFTLRYKENSYCYCLNEMLKQRLVLDAYALHDGPYFLMKHQDMSCVSARQVLYENWTGLANILVGQPIHIINEYLGEKVAMFFGFYGLYTFGLVFPALCGVMAFVYDWFAIKKDSDVTDYICKALTNHTLTRMTESWYPYTTSDYTANYSKFKRNRFVCPNCRHYSLCPYNEMKNYCTESRMIDTIETPAKMQVVPGLVFIWAVILMKIWQNKENYYVWMWEIDVQHAKSLFRVHCKGLDHDLTTCFPRRCCLLLWTLIQLACIVFACVLLLYALLEYRYYLLEQFRGRWPFQQDWKRKYYTYMFLGINHMMIVFIIENLSRLILYYTIKLEQFETRKEKEDAVAFRLFAISFLFTFLLVSFIAFMKGQLYRNPVDDYYWKFLGGIFMENCHPLTCTDEVLVVMLSVLIMRELVFKFLPYFWCFGGNSDYSDNIFLRCFRYPYWERERLMYTDEETDDFITRKFHEIMMQFAVVTLFVAVCPLAPAFGLLTSLLDLRFCARRILIRTRRPLLPKVAGIGFWRHILFFIVFMIAVTNTMLLVITSDFILRTINFQDNNDTDVFDHIDFIKENRTYTDFTLFNGHQGDVDTSLTFGHITMKVFTEYDYTKYNTYIRGGAKKDSPLHEYLKYVSNNYSSTDMICELTMPPGDPYTATDYYNCSYVYTNVARRHCFYRGFTKRVVTSTRRGVNVYNKTTWVYLWRTVNWYWNIFDKYVSYNPISPTLSLRGIVYDRAPYTYTYWFNWRADITSFWRRIWGWGWRRKWHHGFPGYWGYAWDWEVDVRYWADVYHFYGIAVNWQEVYISHMKWYYFTTYVMLGAITILAIYCCLPNASAEVYVGYASERHIGAEFERKPSTSTFGQQRLSNDPATRKEKIA